MWRSWAFLAALFVLLVVFLVLTVKADAAVIWRGDERPSQWDSTQSVIGPFQISSPVRQGNSAIRYVVRPGDDPINSSGERSELVVFPGTRDGDEEWWAWSTYFPEAWNPNPNTEWNIITQWHHTGSTCGPPLSLRVDTRQDPNYVRVKIRGGNLGNCSAQYGPTDIRLHDVEKGKWFDYIVHVVWRDDPSGLVEVWVNGNKVVSRQHATLYSGQGAYFKQGLYRGESNRTTEIIHDGTVLGQSFEDVRGGPPPPEPPPPPPLPAPDEGGPPQPDPVPALVTVRWDGKDWVNPLSFARHLAKQGWKWRPFIRKHPAIHALLPQIAWDGELFYFRRDLRLHLGLTKEEFKEWKRQHPAAMDMFRRFERG